MKRMQWFGYIDKENKVYVSLYSYWDYYQLKQTRYYTYIIEPFFAKDYQEALCLAEKECNRIIMKEIESMKKI